jgi:7-cyano-7-deazaguanine reductase
MSTIPLGQSAEYPEEYAPEVLFPVARAEARATFRLTGELPFHGTDVWNAWELTWLDSGGKPVIATATIRIDANSPSIIESKSLKLYLGSLAMCRYDSADELKAVIIKDLSAVAGTNVEVSIDPGPAGVLAGIAELPGSCVDGMPFNASREDVDATLLACSSNETVSESLHSHLLRSLCPVTNQPDYGSVLIRYRGPKIEASSILEYLVSFRQHNDFHEACVERMFLDICERCRPDKLTVYARYTRRGGIDINPFRSNFESETPNLRLWRQ